MRLFGLSKKKLCEATSKTQSVLKFSDVLFAFSQMEPPMVEASGQVDIFVRSLGHADLWSDILPWIRLWVRLIFLSDLQVRLIFGQMYPPIAEALGQVDIFVRSSGQVDLWSDLPPVETFHGQVWYYIEQAVLGWPLVRCTLQDQASGQVDIFVRPSGQSDLWSDILLQDRHLMTKCGTTSDRLTCSQMYPPGSDFGSGWHLCKIITSGWNLVRFTPPAGEALGQVDIFVRSSGQADFWSDVTLPPS